MSGEPGLFKTIDVWHDTISTPRPCNGPTCPSKIVWAVVAASGRKMCFTHPTEPIKINAWGGHRAVAEMPFDRNHWATCPDKQQFKRKKP
jgi:hypothetical protein